MQERALELGQLAQQIVDALEENPPNWVLASDRWLDLSAARKNTSLEAVVDWIGEGIRIQDVRIVRSLLSRLKSRFDGEGDIGPT